MMVSFINDGYIYSWWFHLFMMFHLLMVVSFINDGFIY